jgi:xanthine dehydrogenase small subunit
MRSALSPLRLARPRTLRQALDILAAEPDRVPLAGCTDVYVSMAFGTLHSTSFIDIRGLAELRGIRVDGDGLRLGALCTHTDIVRSQDVASRLPMLVAASREIGGVQIQNRGTIGGNIANASPAGDTLPVFAAADATLVLVHSDGERRVPFNAFYTGYRTMDLRPGELIAAVQVTRLEGAQWFRKVGTRAAQSISKIVFAGVRGAAPRLAIGSVAPTVLRLPRTESALAEGADAEACVAAMQQEIAPIDDIRSSAEYRRSVAANLLRRFIADTA